VERQLTPEQVAAIAAAAHENALDLMGHSNMLLDTSPTLAYALGVTAVEELAKSLLCRTELRCWTGELTVHALKKILRGGSDVHRRRYAQALEYLWSLSPGVPLPPGASNFGEVARVDQRARMRALYVDVAPDGRPMTPVGVNTAEARIWVLGMRDLFAILATGWSANLAKDLGEARKRALSPGEGAAEQMADSPRYPSRRT
jgi:AbiV family abortive infection protein